MDEESTFWNAMQEEGHQEHGQPPSQHDGLLRRPSVGSSNTGGGGGSGSGTTSPSSAGGTPTGGVLANLQDLVRAAAGSAGGIVHTSSSTTDSSSGSSGNGARRPRGASSHLRELQSPAQDAFHYRQLEDEEGGGQHHRHHHHHDEEDEDEDDDDDDEGRAGWAPVANLDVFFQVMYKYYQNKGFHSILAAGATNLVSMAFTVALSTWLFAYVDWGRLTTCHDEDSCLPFHHYIHAKGMSRYGLVWMYCCLFVLYWLVSCYWFALTLKDAAEMRDVYTDRLGISHEELTTIEWHEVVARFLEKQRSGTYRVSINRDITAHDIACRIMRRENFLIALINRRVLDLSLPRPAWLVSTVVGGSAAAHATKEVKPQEQFLTRNLEWSLHVCLLNDMFNEKFTLRRDFLTDEAGLRRRFVLVGMVQLALMPFLLVFMVIQFFLQNAQEWQQKKNYLGPRQWSPLAQWRFREYNEVPHLFERRLRASYPYALQYTRQSPKPVLAVLARCAAYISGSVVAVLLLFTLLDESILLYVRVWDRNLLWYVGVFSAIFAMSRSFIPGPEEEAYGSQEATMQKVAAHTHYFPSRWRGRCSTQDVRAEFGSLFQYKTALFQLEILSVVVTPLILCLSLPECAGAILAFLKSHHETVDGLGSVCAFSLFDLEKWGTPRYGGRSAEAEAAALAAAAAAEPVAGPEGSAGDVKIALLSGAPTSRGWEEDGKVEKSLLNFCVNYPEWQSGPQAQSMLTRLHAFQEKAMEEEEVGGGWEGGHAAAVPGAAATTGLAAGSGSQEGGGPAGGEGGGGEKSSLSPPQQPYYYYGTQASLPRQQQAGGYAAGGMPPPPPFYRPGAYAAAPYRCGYGGGGMGGSWGQSSGAWGGSGYGGMGGSMVGGMMLPPPVGGGPGAARGLGMQQCEMESSFFWLEKYAERFEQLKREGLLVPSSEGTGGGRKEEEGREGDGGMRRRQVYHPPAVPPSTAL